MPGCGCLREQKHKETAETQCCPTCQPCPRLRHSEITADLFEHNPNTISLIHHKIKACFPIPGTEQWEKTKLASVLSLNEGNPSPRLPWGKQLPGALQHTGVVSFLQLFFKPLLSHTYLQLLMHTGSSLFLQAAQTLCPNSNHINVPCLSTSFTWHESSLCSTTHPKSPSFTQYFLLDLLINT